MFATPVLWCYCACRGLLWFDYVVIVVWCCGVVVVLLWGIEALLLFFMVALPCDCTCGVLLGVFVVSVLRLWFRIVWCYCVVMIVCSCWWLWCPYCGLVGVSLWVIVVALLLHRDCVECCYVIVVLLWVLALLLWCYGVCVLVLLLRVFGVVLLLRVLVVSLCCSWWCYGFVVRVAGVCGFRILVFFV